MENKIIAEGKTTNEAIENGLKILKVSKNKVDIKVLENQEKRSFFSILAPRVVKVELTLKEKMEKKVEVINKEYNSNINEIEKASILFLVSSAAYNCHDKIDQLKKENNLK